MSPDLNKISVHDMSRTQFPAYMNRIYGRKQSDPKDFLTPQPYEIPNLTLFPTKKPALTEEQRKQIQSGVIRKVSVQNSSNKLPLDLPHLWQRDQQKL